MSIEKKIEELQRQLAVKTAYLTVKVSFGQVGKSLPEDVKTEVINKLQEICASLAEGEELKADNSNTGLTAQEIEILKQISAKVLNPTTKATAKVAPPPIPQPNPKAKFGSPTELTPNPMVTDKAVLITLSNIDATLRSKVAPQSEVQIMDRREDQLFVQDPNGRRFWVPSDDVEITHE